MTADAYIWTLEILKIVHTKKKTIQKKGEKEELQDSSSFSQPVKQTRRAKRLHLQFNSWYALWRHCLKHLKLRRASHSIRLPFGSENPRVSLDGLRCDITKNNTFKSPEREGGSKKGRKEGRDTQNPNKSKLKKINSFHQLSCTLPRSCYLFSRRKGGKNDQKCPKKTRKKKITHSHKTLKHMGVPELPQSQNPADFWSRPSQHHGRS